MKQKTLIIFAGILVTLAMILLFLTKILLPHRVTIISSCQNKIVYTLDQSVDKKSLQADCARREGEFNTCGSVCSKKGEMVITVCAVTCEFK